MRSVLTMFLFLAASSLVAQTYYYVNTIQVSPNQPDTQDPITVSVSGDLSSSGAYIVSAMGNVNGSLVELNIVAADPGGLAVLVPHTENIQLGQLPPGTYTIVINGTNVNDLAPVVEHEFTVSSMAGSACDSLDILSLSYSAFTEDSLALVVVNGSSVLFDYPGFVLLDGNNDTLAKEVVDLFGIADTSYHLLAIHPGATIPNGPFTATLELWTLFYGQLACSFNLIIDLCPPPPCIPVFPYVINYGGAMVQAVFPWSLANGMGTIVASGQLELDQIDQFDLDSVCVPPGDLTFTMTSIPPFPGGQMVYGLSPFENVFYQGIQENFIQGGAPNELYAPFFTSCVNGTNTVSEHVELSAIRYTVLGDILHVIRADGDRLGTVTIVDATGRMVAEARSGKDQVMIDLGRIANGTLVVRVQANGSGESTRFVLMR